MKATETKLLAFLKKSPQFVIPIYQRTYSWEESQCRQLWEDILRAGGNDETLAHFVGSIVYIEESLYQVSNQSSLLVIDGQQRLTTVMLILEALARFVGDSEPHDDFSARKIRNRYLLDPEEDENSKRRYKLLLTQTDEESLLSILNQRELPAERSARLEENFDYFKRWIKESEEDISSLCKGLVKLMVVDITLSRDQDNPQLIFESMNSTGLELSQADLIRNFILMGLELKLQTKLYKDYWRPMEIAFGQEAYSTQFDKFMRHYLTLKSGEIPKVKQVYQAFKKHARSPQVKEAGIEALVTDLRTFAGYYCAMALGKESDSHLNSAFHDLRELKVDVAYPFLLELYHDYSRKTLTAEDLEQAVRLVESYVFRRAVCNIPPNSLNKTFANFSRTLKKDHYLESIQANFLLLPSYRRLPDDGEFLRDIKVRDLYNFRSRSYWLRRLENHERRERVPVGEYTIEHILPQNPNLSSVWRDTLGENWKQIHKTYLHTLGNLTLTGYNAEYSDRPFEEKRDMKGGFKESPIHLNKDLGGLDTWNEASIQDRANHLAKEATCVWLVPTLPDDVLDSYRPKTESEVEAYSIETHPHLADGSSMRPLFDKFRSEMLAIDPCVSEEFFKQYVAYKAETNFVGVVPQAKRLRLILNISFHELHDPRGIARDVTNIGHWGNGDAEVGLSSLDEFPYVLGLVRQSFEKQLGDEMEDN